MAALTRSEIADKIRKLLALAEGAGTEAEAANAAGRAAALMARHQIEQADVDTLVRDVDDPMTQAETEAVGRLSGWRKKLSFGVAIGCGTFGGTVKYNGQSRTRFYGRTSDVETSLYLFAALTREIERLAKRNASGRGAAYANAYKLGAATTIYRRFEAMRRETIEQARHEGASSAALVKVGDSSELAKAFALQGGVKTTKARSRCSDSEGYSAGQADGRRVSLGGGAALGQGRKAIGTGG